MEFLSPKRYEIYFNDPIERKLFSCVFVYVTMDAIFVIRCIVVNEMLFV